MKSLALFALCALALTLTGCSSGCGGGQVGGGSFRLGMPSVGLVGPGQVQMQPDAQVVTQRYILQQQAAPAPQVMRMQAVPAAPAARTFGAPCP